MLHALILSLAFDIAKHLDERHIKVRTQNANGI